MSNNVITLADVTNEEIEKSGFQIIYNFWKNYNSFNSITSIKDEAIFIHKFFSGYRNRPSVRISNPSKTYSDPLIEKIVDIRLKNQEHPPLDFFKFAHRVEMAVENVNGAILEEYIHEKLLPYGWSNCWGETIKAADFYNKNSNSLIQIKNKSNTENSSSNKIRLGRDEIPINVWVRMNANTGKVYWNELNSIIGKDFLLSEVDFQNFAIKLVEKNPDLICLKFK